MTWTICPNCGRVGVSLTYYQHVCVDGKPPTAPLEIAQRNAADHPHTIEVEEMISRAGR